MSWRRPVWKGDVTTTRLQVPCNEEQRYLPGAIGALAFALRCLRRTLGEKLGVWDGKNFIHPARRMSPLSATMGCLLILRAKPSGLPARREGYLPRLYAAVVATAL